MVKGPGGVGGRHWSFIGGSTVIQSHAYFYNSESVWYREFYFRLGCVLA